MIIFIFYINVSLTYFYCSRLYYRCVVKYLMKYFKKTYLLSYEIKEWNYFDNIENITNNACESYNNYINSYLNKKPTFYKLLYF